MPEIVGTVLARLNVGKKEASSLVNTLVKKPLKILTLRVLLCTMLSSELVRPLIVEWILSLLPESLGINFNIDSSKFFLNFCFYFLKIVVIG